MAAAKYLSLVAGVKTEVLASQNATANAIAAMGADGRLGSDMMPVGVGPEVTIMPASGSLAEGDFVNTYNNAGTINARKADGSVAGKSAQGFVIAAYSANENAVVYGLGGAPNSHVTGKSVGARQYLSVSAPGQTQESATYTAGQVCQFLGVATSATEIGVVYSEPVTMA